MPALPCEAGRPRSTNSLGHHHQRNHLLISCTSASAVSHLTCDVSTRAELPAADLNWGGPSPWERHSRRHHPMKAISTAVVMAAALAVLAEAISPCVAARAKLFASTGGGGQFGMSQGRRDLHACFHEAEGSARDPSTCQLCSTT